MAANPQQQQPDLNAMVDSVNNIARSSTIFATQLDRFQNLPAFDNGAQILNEIRQLRTHLDARLGALDARLGALDARLGALDARLIAMDYNSIARLTNSTCTTEDSQLLALKTPQNEEADGFPETIGDIDRLSSAQLNALLGAFGLPVGGLVVNRRRMFKKYIGVVAARI